MVKTIFFNEVDSTNTYLKANYQVLSNKTVVYTNHQTAGRGRTSHNWYDEPGKNLLFSILYKEANLKNYLKIITLKVAESIYKVISKEVSKVTIKWPNDIYVNGLKLCGILTESVIENDNLKALIIGIGINVNETLYPVDIKDQITSLKLLTKKTYSRKKLLNKLVKEITKDINEMLLTNTYNLDIIKNNSFLQDKVIIFKKGDENSQGLVKGINDNGDLLVETNGKIITLYNGEVNIISKE